MKVDQVFSESVYPHVYDLNMIASCCTYPYISFTKIWLRSLILFGKVPEKKIVIVAIGGRHATATIRDEIHEISPSAKIIAVNLEDKEFQFLSIFPHHQFRLIFFDYIKAWLGKMYTNYIWMDSDMIVTKKIWPNMNKFLNKKNIMMSADVHGYKDEYIYFYKKVVGLSSSDIKIRTIKSFNITYNCGVIVVDRNYAKIWEEYFKILSEVAKDKKSNELLTFSTAGQIIWNIIYWEYQGKRLPGRYNSLVGLSPKQHSIIHYIWKFKYFEMMEKAEKLKLF